MYVRFRNSRILSSKDNGTFEELYQQIHGKLPKVTNPNCKPNFRVQIYLVKSQWINGKSKQIYIGVIASVKVYFDKNKKLIIDDKIWECVEDGFIKNNVSSENQKLLLKKIENYFNALENSEQ